ncbi:membrane protein [Amylibacter marinus]|uniref:Membrane protein n=1 Tax=Amylibacter marinus TaxID=1475483 RepID=A0ABQ5VRV1_9RHOB|nr:neutral zinc metallopeptidase [Amylibacter marinus]GLQ34030.1 membrane protein [Amylibacter marinus]
MKWRNARGSRNIEDRRSSGGNKARAGGGMGILGLVVVLGIGYFFDVDVSSLLSNQSNTTVRSSAGGEMSQKDKEAGAFVSAALGYTEEVWHAVFPKQVGKAYRPTTLVLFKGVTQSPCGSASGATGPFYCPADRKVYLDTDFFTTLSNRLGAKGDFAAAYVVGHEVAHHVQNELGVLTKANRARKSMSARDSNLVSVMIELQADCFAGIWARFSAERLGVIESGDIEEAMNAAKRIGDDTLQRNAGKRPQPHTYTHGTSEQRQRWFARGYQSAEMGQCDTFAAQQL